MIETVVSLNGQVNAAVAGKPKIERTMGKCKEIFILIYLMPYRRNNTH